MNISSSSSETNPNLHKNIINIKYYKGKKKTKLKNFIEITNTFIKNWKAYIINLKEILKIKNSNISDTNLNSDKILENIDNITKKIEILFSKYINDLKNSYNSQYENILKLYEQKIRALYENKFNLELNKKILEESNKNLLRKEKEYELIKQKTGIVIYDNKIINNDRKENEIFILRKENSILKDLIEKQKIEKDNKDKEINYKEKVIIRNIKNLSRSKKGSKEKSNLNKKLIIKSHNLSKLKSRQKAQSLSLGPQNFRKIHHSHPKSRFPFKFDFLSSVSNSLSHSKNGKLILNSHSYKNYSYDLAKKLFNTSNKKKSKSKPYLSNIINNIKIQKINDIKKISPLNILKKRKIPNIINKHFLCLNKKENYHHFLQNNLNKKYAKNKSNNSTMCIKNTKRDTNNTNNTNNYSSYSKKKNNSECFTDKNSTNNNNPNILLYSSVMKTVNNEKSKSKNLNINRNRQTQNKKCLSPSYANVKYLLPKVQNLLNLGFKEIKSSKSFTRKNKNFMMINDINEKNKKNGFNIKRLFLHKVDSNNIPNTKNINLVYKRDIKNISKNSRYNNSNKKIKITRPKTKSNIIMNNIKTINNANNNSKIKIKTNKK